jgi:putative transposase
LYRAVDKAGDTIAFLLGGHRDKATAKRYFEKSIEGNSEPEVLMIDKSGASLAVLEAINAVREMPIRIRQSKYLKTSSNRTTARSSAGLSRCSG